jgi:hypothetical protein
LGPSSGFAVLGAHACDGITTYPLAEAGERSWQWRRERRGRINGSLASGNRNAEINPDRAKFGSAVQDRTEHFKPA